MKVTVSSAVRFYRVEMLTCYFTKRKADKPFGKICILTRLKFVGRFWLGRCFFFNMNPRKYLGYWRNIRKPAGHKIKNNLHTFCNGSSRQAFLKEHLAPIQILFTVYPAMKEPFLSKRWYPVLEYVYYFLNFFCFATRRPTRSPKLPLQDWYLDTKPCPKWQYH